MKNQIMHNIDNVINDINVIIETEEPNLSTLDYFYRSFIIRSVDSYLFFTDGSDEKTEN